MATTLPNTGAIIPAMTEAPDQAVNNAAFTAIDAKVGAHLAESVSERVVVIRDLSLTGSQTISTAVNKKIKSIVVNSAMTNSTKWSSGICDENGKSACTYMLSSGLLSNHETAILMFSENLTTDRVYASVTSIGTGEFTLNWTKIGAGATGNARLIFLIQYHGEVQQ